MTTFAAAWSAPFENLDFEDTNPASVKFITGSTCFGSGLADNLLPSWSAFEGDSPITAVGFNLSSEWLPFALNGGLSVVSDSPIHGRFSLVFEVTPIPDPLGQPLMITQRGEIPSDTQFLTYTYQLSPFDVSINGTRISPAFQNSTSEPTTVFIDVAPFAGQAVDLAFHPGRNYFNSRIGTHRLDNIGFAVPEPSVVALFGLGMIGLVALRLGRSRQSKSPSVLNRNGRHRNMSGVRRGGNGPSTLRNLDPSSKVFW